jgi:CheY-like chemotaxis protein
MAATSDPKLVLIAEDEMSTSTLLDTIIKSHGYKTKCVKNGRECLETLEKTIPGVILLDIMMPEVDGFETLIKIKSKPATKEVKVVMCSVLNKIHDVEKSFQWGASGYITKPFHPDRILAKVSAILNEKN